MGCVKHMFLRDHYDDLHAYHNMIVETFIVVGVQKVFFINYWF